MTDPSATPSGATGEVKSRLESVPASAPPSTAPVAPGEADFSSVHSTTFPQLLHHLGVSLVVSTHQAHKLIVLRADGDTLNTHFCPFDWPTGIAFHPEKSCLMIGSRRQVWDFRNHPGVTGKLEPSHRYDAAFLPRSIQFTGDIRIHDLAWAGEELWAVNTRFSCLCTFSKDASFVPRWRPPFISAMAAEDRCHLNGLACDETGPRLVTLLAQTDTAGGWRAHKRDGGCLWDVQQNRPIVTGLSMPHSPRFHEGRIWILESGWGAFGTVDQRKGTVDHVSRLPGFTRGLCFAGPYAFVGLSKIRESNVFGGIPIAESKQPRECGIWAIDIRTGQTVAFVQFSGVVQEIFAVEVLPDLRFPEIINESEEVLDSSYAVPDEAMTSLRTRGHFS